MTIEAAIADLQASLLSLSGMKAAPAAPTEGTGAFPFAVSYERVGTLNIRSASFGDDLATIFCEIHVARQSLPQDIALAMTFRDAFLRAILADPTLGGTVSAVNQVRRTFGAMEWGGMQTIGYRFEIDVKVRLDASEYYNKVLSTEAANLIAYWRLNESTGTLISDSSGHACHGTAVGVGLQNDVGIDGHGAIWFDGAASLINIYSTALRDLFNSAEGTVMIWSKVSSLAVYTDGLDRSSIMLRSSAANYAHMKKSANSNQIIYNYNANGVVESPANYAVSDVTWMHHVMTWSVAADEVRGFIDGVQFDTTKTALGTWVGQLASGWCAIGSDIINNTQYWHGWLCHAVVWSKALAPAQITNLANTT